VAPERYPQGGVSGNGADDGRDQDSPADFVVGNLQVEGLEDLALYLRRRLGQRPAQVGNPGELLGQLLVLHLAGGSQQIEPTFTVIVSLPLRLRLSVAVTVTWWMMISH
jgi:hypothetical protein